jgi:hypothetical protein
MSSRKVALFKILAISAVFLVAGALFIMWAKDDTETQLAEDVRDLLGLPHPFVELPPEPVVEPEPVVVPEVVVEPEPYVEPEPVVLELSFQGLVEHRHLWPKSLDLTFEANVPILYQERNFGTIRLVPGETFKVEMIYASREVLGSVNGRSMIISAEQTNLLSWFNDKYRGTYVMAPSEVSAPSADIVDEGERFHVDLLEGMRKWCNLNYGDCTFEISDDALVLRWSPGKDVLIDYRAEARLIAREYLQRQAVLGATDNYACCEIYDRSSKRLLGLGSFFLHSFVAQEYNQ